MRGRVGYLFIPTVLIYATGGLAYGQANLSTNIWANGTHRYGTEIYAPGIIESKSFSNTLAGWTAGGGIEWMFLQNWSTKVEYLYYDLGAVSYSIAPLATTSGSNQGIFSLVIPKASTRFNGNIIRAGVNYHFNLTNFASTITKF